MAQLAFEFVYSAVVEVLCYGLERLTRDDFMVGTVGFLLWCAAGIRAWELFST